MNKPTKTISLEQYTYNNLGFSHTKAQRQQCFFEWCKLNGMVQTHIRIVKK